MQLKINLLGFAFVVLLLLCLFWRGCKCDGRGRPATDTVSVKIDTVWMASKTDTFYTPAEKKTEYVPVYKTDTLEWTEYKDVDTAAILKDHYATRFYQDTIPIQYGEIYINDTITRNKIKSRGVKTAFNIPIVEKTVTLTQPKRNIAYLGFEGMGNEQSIVFAVGASLGMKFKNDKYYGVKALLTKDGNPVYGLEFKIPIRFNKR